MLRRLVLVLTVTTGVLAAQDPPGRVGRLSYIEGSVSFQPAGVTDWAPATVNRPLTVGDQLYCDDGARAEVYVPGAAFHLGPRTAFEFLNLDDRNVQIRLSEGTLDVRVRRLRGENFEIDTANQAFTIQQPGDYRIDTNPDSQQTYVTVHYGTGQITTNSGTFPVSRGQQAVLAGQDQVQPQVYEAPATDDFDAWADSRDRRADRASRYVSPDVVGYEDLDSYGSWQSVPQYGEVWTPSAVPAGWAPYHFGQWTWVDPWGWTWVDSEPWGFAPFHYGRWAFVSDRWCWVPGPVAVEPVYAPALVAWFGFGGGGFGVSLGFGGGDVGWFPLGPRDVYIPAYQASQTYITQVNTTNTTVINNTQITNVYNNYTRTGSVPITTYANRTVPGAAVAVPQNALTNARPVQQAAVRIQPNQISAIRSAAPAPRVAPSVASVLGHSGTARVARPPAAVLSKPIVAKTAPPPPPALFQQRRSLMAKNPGRPVPIQQQRQIARSAPAPATARPPVRVVTQAPRVAPQVIRRPGPQPGTVAQHPATQPNAMPGRSYLPPAAQRPVPQAQPNRPQVAPQEQPRVQAPPNRPFEPPRTQPRATPQAQPNRPEVAPREQPRVQTPPNRPIEPPRTQPRATPQAQPNRPEVAPREQPRVQTPPNRPFEPPRTQPRATPQAQPNRPEVAPREQPRVQAPPPRPSAPPPEQRRPEPQARPQPRPVERQAAPPPEQRRPEPQARPQPRPVERQAAPPPKQAPAKPRRTDEKKKQDQPPQA